MELITTKDNQRIRKNKEKGLGVKLIAAMLANAIKNNLQLCVNV